MYSHRIHTKNCNNTNFIIERVLKTALNWLQSSCIFTLVSYQFQSNHWKWLKNPNKNSMFKVGVKLFCWKLIFPRILWNKFSFLSSKCMYFSRDRFIIFWAWKLKIFINNFSQTCGFQRKKFRSNQSFEWF